MGFLSGLVTGAATSIDNKLKADMKRSEERAEGMAQYRVTRRRAALEAQEKETKEIRDVMNNLASLVDGDVDKAAQLYVNGGKNVAGATKLYQDLKLSADNNIDISTLTTFAAQRAEPGKMSDYLTQFSPTVSALPISKNEVKGSGLYGALFKPDFSDSIMRQVDEAAPLPETPTSTIDVKGAVIDRSKMFTALERERLIKERGQADTRFQQSTEAFETSQAQAKQAMANVEFTQNRLDKLDKTTASQQEIENARADVASAQAEQRIALAVRQDERDAQKLSGALNLQELNIQERQMAIDKAKNAPKFATFELMLQKSIEDISRLENIPPAVISAREKQELVEARAASEYAIGGLTTIAAAKDTTAGGYTPTFSNQTIDSILNAEIKRQLEPVGLVEDIQGKLNYKLRGNEVQYFERMTRALDGVQYRVAPIGDSQMDRTIANSRNTLSKEIAEYISTQIKKPNIKIKQAASMDEAITNAFESGMYKAGDIIQYPMNGATVNTVWTGSDLVK